MPPTNAAPTGLKRYLPPIGSPAYHIMLAVVAIFILGPLGGISAAYMNFSIGFFVGGQVLAGILGSTVTLPYGAEGKHGANYMQTMAASVAGMCGMAVLMQAMVWMDLPEPPAWKFILYLTAIGMFGVGVGMLYTPVLVDRMQLTFPSGYAVANILRALTDKELLKRSIAKLGGGMLGGYGIGLTALKIPAVGASGLSVSTFGAGMIVGARIALPALVVGLAGQLLTPYLVSIGWLQPKEPFRRIGFILALGTILGAAIVDITIILFQAVRRLREKSGQPVPPAEDWKRVNVTRLILWVAFWGAAVVLIGSQVLHQPPLYLTVAVGLCFLFVLVNGISLGISDSNPVSSAFVLTVFILAAIGLRDPGVGLMCASILLIACGVGGDMQQDRSTGWRLGTNRVVQFRYQVIGILMGAVLAVALAKIYLNTPAYAALRVDQLTHPNTPGTEHWNSAMTYKFVGALRDITNPKPHVIQALRFGIFIGLFIELARKLIKGGKDYQRFAKASAEGRAVDFTLDAFLLPSPYASSFGGFVPFNTTLWWTAGGLIGSAYETVQEKMKPKSPSGSGADLPPDMSATSLVGGGLIAGDSLAALTIGIWGLLHTFAK